MTKWEYVTVPLLTHATKQILDNWGDEGYELVAVVPGPNAEQLVAYMKRPKSSARWPHERACERIGKYSAFANADSERQRGGLMSEPQVSEITATGRLAALG